MKKFFLFLILLNAFFIQSLMATDLIEVYNQALKSDPIFKAALAEYKSNYENLRQAQSQILPQINFSSNAFLSNTRFKTEGMVNPLFPAGEVTWKQRGLGYNLNLTQSVFNLSYWLDLATAKNSVKASFATFSAASQDLMKRTVNAFFDVLQAREVLRFAEAEKIALKSEYERAYQSFKVGVKTIIDVHNAKAALDEAIAKYVTAKNDLENSKEDLRVITGVLYNDLNWLKQDFPLVSPNPRDINEWVNIATSQNWSLKASKYKTLSSKDNINASRSDHLPILDFVAEYNNDYTRVIHEGNERQEGPIASLNLNLPVFSGGAVTSEVRRAIAKYQFALSFEEQTYRNVLNDTRKSYLGIMSDISKIKAQKQAVISNQSSLEGMQEGYKVGTRTIVDVLDSQKSLYESQKNYAISRYTYIRNTINLKLAAGTLSVEDLLSINQWLGETTCKKNCSI